MAGMDTIYFNKKTKEQNHSDGEAEDFASTAEDGTDDVTNDAAPRFSSGNKRKSGAVAGSSRATLDHDEDQMRDSQSDSNSMKGHDDDSEATVKEERNTLQPTLRSRRKYTLRAIQQEAKEKRQNKMMEEMEKTRLTAERMASACEELLLLKRQELERSG